MTIDEVKEYYGSRRQACIAAGVNRQAFTAWQNEGKIPLYRQMILERDTGGVLKADIPEKTPQPVRPILTTKSTGVKQPLLRYRYYSNVFGLCIVKKITYLDGGSARIHFQQPGSDIRLYSSTSLKGILRSSGLYDTQGNEIYEGDVLSYKKGSKIKFFKFESMAQLSELLEELCRKNIKVIGNIFDGVNYD